MARRRRRLRRRTDDSIYHDGSTMFADNCLYIKPNRIIENRFASRYENRIDMFSEDHIVIRTRKGFYQVSINKKAKQANNSAIQTGKYKKGINR